MLKVRNPATGEVVGEVADQSRADVAKAIDAAHAAFPAWAGLAATERAARLGKFDRLIRANAEALARLLTTEQGKPISEARREVDYGADFVTWYAAETQRVYGETIPASAPNKRLTVLRQPVGVVAAITPWNFPVAMITRKISPALAAGCTVVVKPAKQAPLCGVELGRYAREAGLPVEVVTSSDSGPVGLEFLENPKVRKIAFTGSTEIGRLLMRGAAEQVKRVSLELGGNAPVIVFDDADVETAVAKALWCKFRNAGQTCICANRIFVHEAVYDAFAAKLAAKAKALRVGPGIEETTEMGPLIDEHALAKVQEHLADALRRGAKVLTGGKRLSGLFFEPTVLAEATDEMSVAREETFGPLAPLLRFKDEAEVVRRANDTPYGLAAYFFTRDLRRAHRVMERLEYGMVGVNDTAISTAQAPFGGVKQSGMGREGGRHGLDEFLQYKYVSMDLS